MSSARSASSSASVPFAQPMAKPSPAKLGNRVLQMVDGRPEDEGLVVDHAHHRADDVVADCRVLGAKI